MRARVSGGRRTPALTISTFGRGFWYAMPLCALRAPDCHHLSVYGHAIGPRLNPVFDRLSIYTPLGVGDR